MPLDLKNYIRQEEEESLRALQGPGIKEVPPEVEAQVSEEARRRIREGIKRGQ